MTILSYRIAIAEEASVAPLVVQPPFKSRKGELVLVKRRHGAGECFWGLLLDPIDHGSDDWTCWRMTDQEFADQIRKELLEKEKSRDRKQCVSMPPMSAALSGWIFMAAGIHFPTRSAAVCTAMRSYSGSSLRLFGAGAQIARARGAERPPCPPGSVTAAYGMPCWNRFRSGTYHIEACPATK